MHLYVEVHTGVWYCWFGQGQASPGPEQGVGGSACLLGRSVLPGCPRGAETPPGMLVPISTICVKVLCFACAPGLQRSLTCPTDTLTAWAGWEKFQQNPFSSEFADLLEWKCVWEMFLHLSGPDESCARLRGTLPGGLADYLGSSGERRDLRVFCQPHLPWLRVPGWGQPWPQASSGAGPVPACNNFERFAISTEWEGVKN